MSKPIKIFNLINNNTNNNKQKRSQKNNSMLEAFFQTCLEATNLNHFCTVEDWKRKLLNQTQALQNPF